MILLVVCRVNLLTSGNLKVKATDPLLPTRSVSGKVKCSVGAGTCPNKYL